MEVSGAVLRRAPLSSGVGLAGEPSFSGYSAGRRTRVSMRPRGVVGGGEGGFSDHGHLRYYLLPVKCGGGKKEEKKRAKLVKGLSKDLSAFYSMGFGVEAGDGMVGDVKGKMMTEAAELLLSQLKQLKAEEKELKKIKKQEKAAMKAAARMKDPADSSSSGSSSESSDSECETVVKMKTLGTAGMIQAKPDIREISTETPLEPKTEKRNALSTGPECCSSSSSSNVMFASKATDKIEVCMGGKCKKSGASELLMEFEKMVGMEGAVVSCKCMGKCRDGPNVRVLNHSNQGEGDPVKDSRNPLCIGVGLEDVGAIVSNFFGDNKDVGLLAA